MGALMGSGSFIDIDSVRRATSGELGVVGRWICSHWRMRSRIIYATSISVRCSVSKLCFR